ncbi:MAG: hypothetical protein MRY63_13625 [Neomegalonema sp.]|nr:hypothetical protein [Neomegalonema sp.]
MTYDFKTIPEDKLAELEKLEVQARIAEARVRIMEASLKTSKLRVEMDALRAKREGAAQNRGPSIDDIASIS